MKLSPTERFRFHFCSSIQQQLEQTFKRQTNDYENLQQLLFVHQLNFVHHSTDFRRNFNKSKNRFNQIEGENFPLWLFSSFCYPKWLDTLCISQKFLLSTFLIATSIDDEKFHETPMNFWHEEHKTNFDSSLFCCENVGGCFWNWKLNKFERCVGKWIQIFNFQDLSVCH